MGTSFGPALKRQARFVQNQGQVTTEPKTRSMPDAIPDPRPRLAPAAPAHVPRWFSTGQSLLLAGGSVALLLQARTTPVTAANAIWLGTLLTCLWALLAAQRGRIGAWEALLLQAGALATATSALGLREWHLLAKPAAMVFALAAVAFHAWRAQQRSAAAPLILLCGALLASLAGDVALMLPDLFIPGLVAFLLAHLCYLALFRLGAPWFAHRGALAATLALGAAMYALLWIGGLPPALRAPVAAYVLAIALMAAQAWARWAVLRDAPALWVALGTCSFMLSDTLLAVNRFVQPLPWSQVWVLASYYTAQVLIVVGLLRGAARQRH